jgi:glucose 1-dehydrogenase
MRLHGRTALITGAAGGIGLACARRFIEEGARVTIADTDAARGEMAAEALGESCRFVPADVGDKADATRIVDATCDHWGRIDILVSNAGVIHLGDFLELDEADFDRVIRVNLKGSFLVGQAAARRMVAQGKRRRDRQHVLDHRRPRHREFRSLRREQGRRRPIDAGAWRSPSRRMAYG